MEYPEIIFEIIDEIIPFDVDIKEKQRKLLPTSRVLYGPVKREEDTGDDDDTSEKQGQALSRRDTTIPSNPGTI